MKRVLLEWRARVTIGATLGVLLLLASCGGSGVVGSGGTGQAASVTVGTVNGFGSVIVDGVAYDVTSAQVVTEAAPGQDALADVKLGDRVGIDYASNDVATLVRVLPALDGPISSIVSPTHFTILGQDVLVNSIGTGGPVTQFGGGYAQPTDLAVGDPVEVHAVVVPQGAGYVFQATRVSKLAAAPSYLRVSGLVSAWNPNAGGSMTLSGLSVSLAGASVVPQGTQLANGMAVSVLALPGALGVGSGGGPTLTATQVDAGSLRAVGQVLNVSGKISNLNAAAMQLNLGDLVVHFGAAALSPSGVTLAQDQYVHASGTVAADGSLTATSLTVDSTQADSPSELDGDISAWVAASQTFVVRGVTVDASSATLQGCPSGGLANGLYVKVRGSLGSAGVSAQSVTCSAEPSGATIERQGVASGVNAVAQTFVLTLSSGSTVLVHWTGVTYFGHVTPVNLGGLTLQVQGVLQGGLLTASRIGLPNTDD